jgi:hypothetical protein
MKKILLIAIMLASTTALASGKFIFGHAQDMKTKQNEVELGLSVHQKLLGDFYFTNWTGIQATPEPNGLEHDFTDLSFKNGVMYQPMSKLQIEMGIDYAKNVDTKVSNKELYLKVGTQLW